MRSANGCGLGVCPSEGNPTADDTITVLGLKPRDSGLILRQAFPDWQQQARYPMQWGVGELRHNVDLGPRCGGEGLLLVLKTVLHKYFKGFNLVNPV